jgi:hypothetical protein
MKAPLYDYGEMFFSRNDGLWKFLSGEKRTNLDSLMHVSMTMLGGKGWECIFISDNMLHAFFKKIVTKKTLPTDIEE